MEQHGQLEVDIQPQLAWTEAMLLLLYIEIVNDHVTRMKMDFVDIGSSVFSG